MTAKCQFYACSLIRNIQKEEIVKLLLISSWRVQQSYYKALDNISSIISFSFLSFSYGQSKIFNFFMLLIARMLYLLLLVICGDAWKWFFLWMIKERSGLVWIRRGDGWLGPLINFVAKRNPFLNVNEIFFGILHWNF